MATLISLLRKISYFILGLLLGAVITLFWANEAQAITYAPNGTTGLTLAYNGNVDDSFFAVSLPWSINFLGTNYNTIYVGSNGYITFQSGNSTYSGFSASNPAGPHISIYPGDRRLYKLYYAQIDAGTANAHFVVRVEGVDYSSATVTHIYEIHFYPGASYYNIYFIDAPSSGNYGTTGVSNGSAYVLTFTTTELTGIRINYDGTLTLSTPTYTSGITAAQTIRKNAATTARQTQLGNQISIEQLGDNNQFNIRQGVTISGHNKIQLYSSGNYNNLNLNQGYETNGTVSANDSNDHYLYVYMTGNTNAITMKQTGVSQFNESTINGSNNNITNLQSGTGSKTLFQSVTGNNNTINTNQKDAGQDYLDVKLTGNGHTVNVIQEGTGNHAATIDLTNGGGASTVNLNQSGSTPQTYSIQQLCVNAAGCSVTVTQP